MAFAITVHAFSRSCHRNLLAAVAVLDAVLFCVGLERRGHSPNWELP